MRLAWIDLETAGLDPRFHPILEIALVVTDPDLNQLVEFTTVVRPAKLTNVLAHLDETVREMHTKSGLLEQLDGGRGMSTRLAEATVATILEEHAKDNGENLYLAGSGDRKFLERQMPQVAKQLHYRNIDVSTIRSLDKMWSDFDPWLKTDAHRALDDTLDSIAELKYYRSIFFGL